MSWKNIKTFLILLFIIINTYLVFSTDGFFQKPTVTYVDKSTIKDVAIVVKNNYNISLSANIVPKKVTNLKNIDVTNIIYTDALKKSGFDFEINGASFEVKIKTQTYSYNEDNAKKQVSDILEKLGIKNDNYKISTYKSDKGIVCNINQAISEYPIFNSKIKAVCASSEIKLYGTWYVTDIKKEKELITASKMTDITSVIIDVADKCNKSDGTQVKITQIGYGYYVPSYDENIVSKTSPAIPCYMIKTDEGLKYYYDATNGKPIKQED